MNKFELAFIPGPGMGHFASTVEMANLLVNRDGRLSVTIVAVKSPSDTKSSELMGSLSASFPDKPIRFIILPEHPLPEESNKPPSLRTIMESHKPPIREALINLTASRRDSESPKLAGLVIDMFYTSMIDVAKELGVPCYVFFTSNASFIALNFHIQELYDQNNNNDAVDGLLNSDAGLAVPGFVNPIPGKVIPSVFFDKDTAVLFYDIAKKFRSEIDGILINTFAELESHVIEQISSNPTSPIPPLYSVGPVLNLKRSVAAGSSGTHDGADILKWLDDQPPSSVVFLCFGSMGSFDKDQVKEIALALERTGVRFLWSLRQPPREEGSFKIPSDYADTKEVLPEGFLDRTAGIGRVIGWAAQVEILAHPATGGFISHCGWNSTLESLWHGVPIATWPMYAEQQMNAFEMVVEFGLAVEITLDYRNDFGTEKARTVSAEEIENGIRKLMEDSEEMRKKVKTKSEESRKSMREGGSSFISLGHFIDDVLAKFP